MDAEMCKSGKYSEIIPDLSQASDDTSYPCLKLKCGVMVT